MYQKHVQRSDKIFKNGKHRIKSGKIQIDINIFRLTFSSFEENTGKLKKVLSIKNRNRISMKINIKQCYTKNN